MTEKYVDNSDLRDAEPAYMHTVAPDPRRLESLDNPRVQEEGCIGITSEKKYYEYPDVPGGSVFIKRNLTPSEFLVSRATGCLVLPDMIIERIRNEAATIRYIQAHTTIPTPNIRCAFEDHGRFYIITDFVAGVALSQLPDEHKPVVFAELQEYIAQMRMLKSTVMGSVAGGVVLPYRLGEVIPADEIPKLRDAPTPEFVMCHNDRSRQS
ncbi:hypothetical protein HYPSUDRAFT_58877 [Hypholoma sublateritium FD-334 SS-4]|uniref:Aminoglycoside phosphotransferase domain-containing protein n=1 Tax=Hypholoma sublateritium (strain FD-334 SS-4) TaxID=945553 RepID=A0A0D2KL33_HYPSF|nr:hypothetical protein HYPSUDRAFT_58877 [Hypholoma sublateritium FD-334 SS-4]